MIVRTWAGSYVEGRGRYCRILLGWIRFGVRRLGMLAGLCLLAAAAAQAQRIEPSMYSAPTELLRVTGGFLAQVGGGACGSTAGSPAWTGTPHGVCLSWAASTSTVVGYNVYRGTISGGPYSKLTTTLTANLFFLDTTAAVSTQYFYVATAVDSNSNESGYSNQASITTPATFPSNPQAPTGAAAKSQ